MSRIDPVTKSVVVGKSGFGEQRCSENTAFEFQIGCTFGNCPRFLNLDIGDRKAVESHSENRFGDFQWGQFCAAQWNRSCVDFEDLRDSWGEVYSMMGQRIVKMRDLNWLDVLSL